MRTSLSVAVLLSLAAGIAAAPPRPTPAATKTPAPAPGAINSPGEALIQQDEAALAGRSYTYDPAGRRDPFRSLLVRAEDRARGDRPVGVAGMSIDDIVIYGIWKTRSGYIAQVRATDNKSYLVRPGDLLYDGEVTRVGPNEVVFRQNINDPQSVKPFREVTKQLNVTPKP
jgi:type IV pilus assembly protein PilP